MAKKPLRDLVVVLPGITGSVLQKDGRDVWALSGQALVGAVRSRGVSLQRLQLVGGEPGDIVADRLMPDAHLVPGLVKIDGYSALTRLVSDTFDVRPGTVGGTAPANLLPFPYDWRLDNRVSARRLAQVLEPALDRWRRYTGNPSARVILLAHSMGGLVARYYLEVLDGWRDCRALVTFGTPYRGSLNALNFLANGYKAPLLDLTGVMRSLPSVYQLLPIYRALKVGDDHVRVAEAGPLPGVDPTMAADALAFHREIEKKVDEHRDDDEYRRHGYAIVPVVGTRQRTRQSAHLIDGRIDVAWDLPDWIDPLLADGDGTVPRLSAVPIELSDAYRDTYVAERHGSLQCHPATLADLRGRLVQSQARGLGEIRGPAELPVERRPAIALDVEDAYVAGEPVTVGARVLDADDAGTVLARVEPVGGPAGGPAPEELPMAPAGDGWRVVLPDLPAGVYRVRVRTTSLGPQAPTPVHDLFAVTGVTDDATG